MEYALLRSLRVLCPGLALIGYVDLFRKLVLHQSVCFWDLDSAKLFLVAYVVGGVYGVFFGAIRDKWAFEGVNANTLTVLRENFTEIRGLSWREVSPCFYYLIDTDRSLEQKSKGIFFNGLVVTTSCDAVWISAVAGVIGAAAWVFGFGGAFLIVSAASLLLSWMAWSMSVRRHRDLALEQVDVFVARLANEFVSCIDKRSRSRKEAR